MDFPVATGLFPAGGPVAQALGAEELAPETSQDLTFGVTLALGGLTATIDYYQIRIDDRFRANLGPGCIDGSDFRISVRQFPGTAGCRCFPGQTPSVV